jgi:hypothetical protein
MAVENNAEINNAEIVRRFLKGALGEGDGRKRRTVITEFLHPHCTLNAPGFFTGEINDRDGVGNFLEETNRTFPDLKITIESETTQNNDVVMQWRGTGTHTERTVSVEQLALSVFRLSGPKIESIWLATIINAGDGNWSAMELERVIEVVPRNARLAPGEEVLKKRPKPPYCRVMGC